MAGHSQFKNIMHRKGAQDAKRAKKFNKLAREITVATKTGGGPDPSGNPRLRAAISAARADSMPKDRIERAIQVGVGGKDTADYVEIRYEGYGPGGTALIVETLTDNRNRTASEVRAAFNKNGGSMGESGSVAFNFTHCGQITYGVAAGDADSVFERALEAGADEVESTDEVHLIQTTVEDFAATRNALFETLGEPQEAKLIWRPNMTVSVDEDPAHTLLKLIDTLEENDDVQNVYSNFELSEELLQRLAGE